MSAGTCITIISQRIFTDNLTTGSSYPAPLGNMSFSHFRAFLGRTGRQGFLLDDKVARSVLLVRQTLEYVEVEKTWHRSQIARRWRIVVSRMPGTAIICSMAEFEIIVAFDPRSEHVTHHGIRRAKYAAVMLLEAPTVVMVRVNGAS